MSDVEVLRRECVNTVLQRIVDHIRHLTGLRKLTPRCSLQYLVTERQMIDC
jgi:hypothetical protein